MRKTVAIFSMCGFILSVSYAVLGAQGKASAGVYTEEQAFASLENRIALLLSRLGWCFECTFATPNSQSPDDLCFPLLSYRKIRQ